MEPVLMALGIVGGPIAYTVWRLNYETYLPQHFWDWRARRKQQRAEPEIQNPEVFAELSRTKAAMRLEARTNWLLAFEELLHDQPVSVNPLVRYWDGRTLLAVQREIHATVDWNLRGQDRARERIRERYAHYSDPMWGQPGHRGW